MATLDQALSSIDLLLGAGDPPAIGSLFDESFLRQVPEPQLREVFAKMTEQVGACTGHRVLEQLSEHSARVRWSFADGAYVNGTAAVSGSAPGKVVLLRFEAAGRTEDSWAEVEAQVAALPGRCSFEVRELCTGAVLSSLHSDLALCVGSTSKLLIFSCLLDEVAAGRRRWDDMLRLEARHRSAPTGILHDWPEGSPLTLHSAAMLSLTISDNTAADLLLHELGRASVEATLDSLGVGQHALLRPFLATREMFLLQQAPSGLRDRYRAASAGERLGMLVELESEPLHPDRIPTSAWAPDFGWCLSAAETCDLLARLRGQIAHTPTARAMLGAAHSGISSADWAYEGFKGGSSPGRLSFALLLEDSTHRWVGASLVVEATPETLDPQMCAMALKRATDQALAVH